MMGVRIHISHPDCGVTWNAVVGGGDKWFQEQVRSGLAMSMFKNPDVPRIGWKIEVRDNVLTER